ncbi:armadillo repeat-containing protein 10 [Hyperolius riggenbachi]|uniref:armadillo repeat-containing protein 10 n=1 Tax=Hyperolius riggenbachi TaxID=752182 RepID=UPI0035A32535
MFSEGRVTRGLLGLAVGAGLCYCAYRVLRTTDRKQKHVRRGGGLLEKVANIPVLDSVTPRSPVAAEQVSVANLEPHHLEVLLETLRSCPADSSAQEQVLVTLCNCAAFSSNHDIIRKLNGLQIIGMFLKDHRPNIKEKALNALNNLSMNLQNQEQIKDFLGDVCSDIKSSLLNSEVQLAGLRLVVNMSVTNNYHDSLTEYITCFLDVLVRGNENTQSHTLKVLVNLSANPSMTTVLLSSKVPLSLTNLYDSNTNTDILIRALTFAANLSENLGRELHCNGHCHYEDDSLYSLLLRDQSVFQGNLLALLHHPDTNVREQLARIVCPQRLT